VMGELKWLAGSWGPARNWHELPTEFRPPVAA
jgi:hypothetical protein